MADLLVVLLIILGIGYVVWFNAVRRRPPRGGEQPGEEVPAEKACRDPAEQRRSTGGTFRIPLGFQPVSLLMPPVGASLPNPKEVRSTFDHSTTYQVNLRDLLCTCPDFQKRRKDFPFPDARRVCKHIYYLLSKTGELESLDPFLRVFVEDRHPSQVIVKATIGGSNEVIFSFNPGDEWINIYTRHRRRGEKPGQFSGAYDRYGFSLGRDGWSYGRYPAGAGEIRKLIKFLA